MNSLQSPSLPRERESGLPNKESFLRAKTRHFHHLTWHVFWELTQSQANLSIRPLRNYTRTAHLAQKPKHHVMNETNHDKPIARIEIWVSMIVRVLPSAGKHLAVNLSSWMPLRIQNTSAGNAKCKDLICTLQHFCICGLELMPLPSFVPFCPHIIRRKNPTKNIKKSPHKKNTLSQEQSLQQGSTRSEPGTKENRYENQTFWQKPTSIHQKKVCAQLVTTATKHWLAF